MACVSHWARTTTAGRGHVLAEASRWRFGLAGRCPMAIWGSARCHAGSKSVDVPDCRRARQRPGCSGSICLVPLATAAGVGMLSALAVRKQWLWRVGAAGNRGAGGGGGRAASALVVGKLRSRSCCDGAGDPAQLLTIAARRPGFKPIAMILECRSLRTLSSARGREGFLSGPSKRFARCPSCQEFGAAVVVPLTGNHGRRRSTAGETRCVRASTGVGWQLRRRILQGAADPLMSGRSSMTATPDELAVIVSGVGRATRRAKRLDASFDRADAAEIASFGTSAARFERSAAGRPLFPRVKPSPQIRFSATQWIRDARLRSSAIRGVTVVGVPRKHHDGEVAPLPADSESGAGLLDCLRDGAGAGRLGDLRVDVVHGAQRTPRNRKPGSRGRHHRDMYGGAAPARDRGLARYRITAALLGARARFAAFG